MKYMRRHIFRVASLEAESFPGIKALRNFVQIRKFHSDDEDCSFFRKTLFVCHSKRESFFFFRAKLEMLSSAKNPNLSDMIYATMQRF